MAVYEYEGIDSRGKNVKGVVEADSPRAARAKLKKEAVFATELEEVLREGASAQGAETTRTPVLRRGIKAAELALITREIATLLEAGLPLVDALGSLAEQTEAERTRLILSQVRQRVNEGAAFHEALGEQKRVFTDFYRNMIRAGEAAGTLELVLSRLADFMESSLAFRRKVQAAMAYPVLMMIVAIGVIVLLMAKVVPQVTAVFSNLGKELPPTTKALLAASDFFVNYWLAGFIVTVGAVVWIWSWARTPGGRRKAHALILRIPRLGGFYRLAALTRFSKTLGTLVAGGVGLLDAMEITKPVVGNAIIEGAVEEAARDVREGKGLAEALKSTGQFPSEICRMVAVGEESGKLEGMLLRVAKTFESRIEALVASLTSLLEPLMILAMGVIVGFIVYAILSPIFALTEAIR